MSLQTHQNRSPDPVGAWHSVGNVAIDLPPAQRRGHHISGGVEWFYGAE